jgi:hypothetical protein
MINSELPIKEFWERISILTGWILCDFNNSFACFYIDKTYRKFKVNTSDYQAVINFYLKKEN